MNCPAAMSATFAAMVRKFSMGAEASCTPTAKSPASRHFGENVAGVLHSVDLIALRMSSISWLLRNCFWGEGL